MLKKWRFTGHARMAHKQKFYGVVMSFIKIKLARALLVR